MIEYREFLGYLSIVLGLIGYVPYFRDIFKGKTKPHVFSWFVWFVLTAIAFAAQWTEGAGAGSWTTGVTAVACLVICLLAFVKGTKSFPLFDWITLGVALFSLFLWWGTSDPTLSVILIAVIDAVGYIPTFRKGFHKPFEETISTFFLSSIKFVPAIMALENYSIATWFYPSSLVVMNGAFVVMLIIRRRQVIR